MGTTQTGGGRYTIDMEAASRAATARKASVPTPSLAARVQCGRSVEGLPVPRSRRQRGSRDRLGSAEGAANFQEPRGVLAGSLAMRGFSGVGREDGCRAFVPYTAFCSRGKRAGPEEAGGKKRRGGIIGAAHVRPVRPK